MIRVSIVRSRRIISAHSLTRRADHESVDFGGSISGCGKCGISNFCFIVVVVVSCKTMNSWHQKFMQAERKKNFAVKFLFYWFENCLHAFLITDFVLLREYFNMHEYIRRVSIYNSSFWSPSLTRSAFYDSFSHFKARMIGKEFVWSLVTWKAIVQLNALSVEPGDESICNFLT